MNRTTIFVIQLCNYDVVDNIDMFPDADYCFDYLTEIKDEKALMIVSGTFGQHRLHVTSQLKCILVFSENNSISISFLSTNAVSNRNLNELDQSFMYKQLLNSYYT